MWRDLGQLDETGAVLPEVNGERCVHSLLENASCRACVEACPEDAWVIDDEILGINAELCDGCDLCVPVCPQEAMQSRHTPVVHQYGEFGAAFALCEHSSVVGIPEAMIPCLHSLGMRELLRLYRDGVSYLITSCGDCDKCRRGDRPGLKQSMRQVNKFLLSQRKKPLKHRQLNGKQWITAYKKTSQKSDQKSFSRRAFFRGAVNAPVEKFSEVLAETADASISDAPGALLSNVSDLALLPFVPQIDPLRCCGCDACARLCPQGAIGLKFREEGSIAYRIEALHCTGCGVCSDVCEAQAVNIANWVRNDNKELALREARCISCGVNFHLPEASPTEMVRCRICRTKDHNARLYQVLP